MSIAVFPCSLTTNPCRQIVMSQRRIVRTEKEKNGEARTGADGGGCSCEKSVTLPITLSLPHYTTIKPICQDPNPAVFLQIPWVPSGPGISPLHVPPLRGPGSEQAFGGNNTRGTPCYYLRTRDRFVREKRVDPERRDREDVVDVLRKESTHLLHLLLLIPRGRNRSSRSDVTVP